MPKYSQLILTQAVEDIKAKYEKIGNILARLSELNLSCFIIKIKSKFSKRGKETKRSENNE